MEITFTQEQAEKIAIHYDKCETEKYWLEKAKEATSLDDELECIVKAAQAAAKKVSSK